MFAVIFKAEIRQLDGDYDKFASRLQELARSKYGCREFIAVTEGNREVAISYWETLEQITAWKKDPEHRAAQEKGRTHWYRSYEVEVVEVLRRYTHRTEPTARQ